MSSLPTKLVAGGRPAGRHLEGMTAFGAVWLGQVFSLFGSHLTGFALGVWVYTQTRSATDFALISFFTVLPEVALSPVAGLLVDRWDRRRVMMFGALGSGLCAAILSLLALSGSLVVWQIYLLVAAVSAFQSVQFPALSSSVALLVPRQHLPRANGMVAFGTSLAMVAAPLVAGLFLELIGLSRLLLIGVATYGFAVLTLMLVRIAPAGEGAGGAAPARASLWQEATRGWAYVRERRELLALLLLFAVTNFTTGMVQVLLTPLVLSFTTAEVLGRIMSAGGAGVLLGSLLVSVYGGTRRRMRAIYVFTLVRGLILFLGVLQPDPLLVGTAAFLFLFCDPLIFINSQTIWQTKIAPEVLGRAFAVRRVVGFSSMPMAYLIAGPLADRVFEPLMAAGGPLAGSLGGLVGVGPGRGVALLFIALGALTVLSVAAGFLYRPLRELEERLPDCAPGGA
ncbi:MAG TPA: MFS transporter [Pyrinomonadaceae bacterium]|nr:MFS transporter [Pyrinomonadaceae bacterium]